MASCLRPIRNRRRRAARGAGRGAGFISVFFGGKPGSGQTALARCSRRCRWRVGNAGRRRQRRRARPSLRRPTDLYDRIAHNLFSINMVWTLITGFLVMFMQAGFSMVEGGLSRPKNACHTWSMNFMIYPLGCFCVLGLWLCPRLGQLVQRAGAAGLVRIAGARPGGAERRRRHRPADPNAPGVFKYGLLGTKGFFLHGVDDVSVMALFFFMMVFMDTTATIPTGAMAERWHWKNFCLYGFWVALPYCIYANWVWGGGWLAQAGKNWGLGHGAVDFAGSGVVHAMGGMISLAGCIVLGAAHRQIRQRQAAGPAGPQHSDGGHRHVHPGLRLVRL